jgi:tRNA(Ile)-lysidine synthase TilS/MesJ
MELRCSKKGLATMSKKKKPVKVRPNLRTQGLADIEKVQKACKELELALKRVKDDIKNLHHQPFCSSPRYKGD